MKKMYNQPEIEVTDVMPQSIICASMVTGETETPIDGE